MENLNPTDPNNVAEIFCTGPVNLTITGLVATLVFTHLRKPVAGTFGEFNPQTADAVIRARLVLPTETLVELRNLIDAVLSSPIVPGSNARN